MEGEAFLLTISQVAVALAGFSGLVVATRDASRGGWHPRDVWSLSWMLGASLGTLFLSLLPRQLSFFFPQGELVWTVANLALAAFTLIFALAMLLWGRRLTNQGHRPRVRLFPIAASLVLIAAGCLAGLAALGMFGRFLPGIFSLGLLACLLVAAFSLVVFLVLLARPAEIQSNRKH